MKKIILLIVIILAIVLIGFLATKGRTYYQNRYVGEEFYAKVPMNISVELEESLGDDGYSLGTGKRYQLTAYNQEGQAREADFFRYTSDPAELLQPGGYVKFTLSEVLVLKHAAIDKEEVPEKVLAILDSKEEKD
ncbi:MAG: YxeA family protein [Clostridiales bacterium]|nr:YxeA family protein [Clostridiales bacterium]